MAITTLVTDSQIRTLAAAIPATGAWHFAREYLCLSDTDIENASSRMYVTSSEVVYKGLRAWVSKNGRRTVHHAKELLLRAKDDGVKVAGGLQVLEKHASEDDLDTVILSQMSRHFTRETWTIFSQQYLHISQPEIDSHLPIQDNDLHRTVVGLLTKWRTNNRSTATVQHLMDVLNRAVTDGCIEEEAIQALHKAQEGLTIQTSNYSSVISALRILYQTDQYSKLSPLHWDEYVPAYPIQDMYVTMKCQQLMHHPSASVRTKSGKETNILYMSNILEPLDTSGSHGNPKHRILLEGQPGSGKTTLCKKLAYDWSRGVQEVKGLSAYLCVFVIRLSLLQADQSISDYIAFELLNESNSKYTVLSLLANNNCFIILDGYDELHVDNKELNDLIDGSVFAHACVLLTSRPGAFGKIRSKFHLLYKMNDLTDKQVVQFSQKYSTDQAPMFNMDNVERHPLRSFVSTPLYLTWAVMLQDKLSGAQVNNVSDFYKVIVDAIYNKAVQRKSVSNQQCRESFVDLCGIAYRVMCENHMDLNETTYKLTTIQQDLGFTNTYYKQGGLMFIQYYNFNHKTLLEYLTAKHIAHATSTSATSKAAVADSCTNPVVVMLLSVAEVSDIERRVSSQVVQFVLGLLAASNRCNDIQAVIRAVVTPAIHVNGCRSHTPKSHYGLLCLAQFSRCTDLHITDKRLVRSSLWLERDCIGTDCTEGLICYLKRGGNGVERINIISDLITTHNVRRVTTVAVPVINVMINSNKELVRMYCDGGVLVGVETVHELTTDSCSSCDSNEQQIQSAFTNMLRYAWRCSVVYLLHHHLTHVLAAWRRCSQEERGRVMWRKLWLYDCFGRDEVRQIRQLLPDAVELVCV